VRALLILTLLLFVEGAHAGAQRVLDGALITNGAGTLTLPSSTDTLLGRATTDTLTNKSLSGATNTFTLLPVAAQAQQDTFSGNGSTTAFTLSATAGTPSANGMVVYVDGILVEPGGSDYSYTTGSSTITFVTAPAAGQSIRAVYQKF
jgi:hypothetical protein